MKTIYEQLKEVLTGREDEVVTSSDIKALLAANYGTNKDSVLLSDYCYNRYNDGISFTKHLFHYIDRNTYQYIGEGASYTGLIFQRKKGEAQESVVGEWIHGEKYMQFDGVTKAQLMKMYAYYLELWRYEIHILQSKPTELRHLMGRIGELLCVIQTGGQFAVNSNEPGFDVIAQDGRKVSVKTTAQTKSFININRNTFHLFDDLCIVQYKNEAFDIVYYGAKEDIEPLCRAYGQCYELDLSKLKKHGRLK